MGVILFRDDVALPAEVKMAGLFGQVNVRLSSKF